MILPADSTVVVTYTVKAADPVPTTTVPAAVPAPAVTHPPLPLTGAPVAVELIGSFGLLLAGALTAWSAHRAVRRAVPGVVDPTCRTTRSTSAG